MNLKLLSPKQSLNKAYLKEKISRTDVEHFKSHFSALIDKINDKGDEEHLKSLIADFLKLTYYNHSQNQINPIGKNDLVIHTGKSPADPYGVILEVKSIANKPEMISEGKANVKAFHELVLYYLDERIGRNRNELKQLIVTSIYDWYIIDANEFDKKIYRNTAIKKLYELKKSDNKDNPWFYDELRKLLAANTELSIDATFFDLHDFKKTITNTARLDDKGLIPLYKILSPVHLLKLPFANDSNTLQPKFYSELLHLIGLYEYKEGSKKLISRKKDGERNSGSLLENAIAQLERHDKISRLEKPSQYGDGYEQRLYAVALELVITWINRILFLKLLEAQMINYHKGNRDYTFLTKDKIKDFDDLDQLFFSVLAKRANERSADIQKLFGKVPYLNSSLFEPTELEQQTFFINSLENDVALPVTGATVLKDANGKTLKGGLATLDYLFAFLNAYDFSSEGAGEIQEDNKQLINASVLGLIFEKINGYKDGSFFTPGFITMYMCRETIRRAVVQKFNEAKGWDCKEYSELFDRIKDKKEANAIINCLRICDPAVGSGHFLVSALNEIIAIKCDLEVLQYRKQKESDPERTLRDYTIVVENDELIITDDNGDIFEYNPKNMGSQRLQETLFHEKQAIIEGCLFGVDINPNSVKICRLRLWIELLKNAYYKTGTTELETLPNIDINIKLGNSLVNRFALDSDLKQALKKSKFSIESYKIAVQTYREAVNKEEKREMERLINSIKSNFRTEISANDPKIKTLDKKSNELYNKYNTEKLFSETLTPAQIKDRKKLEDEINKLAAEIADIKNNKIYENAFEWRFEFPEVLDDEGDFVGFDVVIGNPPYVRQEELTLYKSFLEKNYTVFAGTADLLVYFIEKGIGILKPSGNFQFIIANKFLRAGFGKLLRKYLIGYQIEKIIDFGDLPVFQEATTYPCIISLVKQPAKNEFIALELDDLHVSDLEHYIEGNGYIVHQNELNVDGWYLGKQLTNDLLNKINSIGLPLGSYIDGLIYRGVLTGLNEAFVIGNEIKEKLINNDQSNTDIIKAFLIGKDIKRYQKPASKNYLIFTRRGIDIEKYPTVKSYLNNYYDKLIPGIGRKNGNYLWYEIQDTVAYYQEFDKPKIIYPNICRRPEFTYDTEGIYTNQKCFIIPTNDKYLLGVLNSSVTFFLFKSILPKLRGDFYEPSYLYLKDFPIAIPDETKREAITILVDQILENKQSDIDTTPLEAEIDQLVYQLYGLTEEEIKIVEGIE